MSFFLLQSSRSMGPDSFPDFPKHFLIFYIFFSVFEEPEDPTNRSFFSEIISSISDVKFSNSGRYMISRDYLSVKVWDLHMETKPIETYTVRNLYILAVLTPPFCSTYKQRIKELLNFRGKKLSNRLPVA